MAVESGCVYRELGGVFALTWLCDVFTFKAPGKPHSPPLEGGV